MVMTQTHGDGPREESVAHSISKLVVYLAVFPCMSEPKAVSESGGQEGGNQKKELECALSFLDSKASIL